MVTPLNILLVEDHSPLRAVTTEVLEGQGHIVWGVSSAEEVDELSSRGKWQVAVLDLNLPGEDGLSLAKRLRSYCPSIGIVMVTARHSLRDKVVGYQQGADIYLTKPTDPDELCAAVAALGRRLQPAMIDRENTLLCLDLSSATLSTPLGPLVLRFSEVRVLYALATAPEGTLAHWELLELLHKDLGDQGKAQLEVLMSRLRRKLLAMGVGAPVLKAERGRGYRLCVGLKIT